MIRYSCKKGTSFFPKHKSLYNVIVFNVGDQSDHYRSQDQLVVRFGEGEREAKPTSFSPFLLIDNDFSIMIWRWWSWWFSSCSWILVAQVLTEFIIRIINMIEQNAFTAHFVMNTKLKIYKYVVMELCHIFNLLVVQFVIKWEAVSTTVQSAPIIATPRLIYENMVACWADYVAPPL